jgi:hypothetical protein
MTAHQDLDRQLSDFLREGPTELPVQSFDAVRDRTEQTRQRVIIGPWRLPEMNKIVTIGLGAAAVVVLVLVGAQLFGSPTGRIGSQTTPTPEPSASVAGDLPEGPHLLSEGTDSSVPITVTIAAPLWYGEPNGGGLCWGDPADTCAGPPDGAGMIAFEGRKYDVYGDACHRPGPVPDTTVTTVDELVNAVAKQVHREESAPEDITVDGYAGTKIVLRMGDEGGVYYGDA